MGGTHARVIAGLFATVLGAAGALAFTGCGHNIDDCRNTRTCIPSSCEAGDGGLVCAPCVDGGMLDGSGDCCKTDDGGLVCAN